MLRILVCGWLGLGFGSFLSRFGFGYLVVVGLFIWWWLGSGVGDFLPSSGVRGLGNMVLVGLGGCLWVLLRFAVVVWVGGFGYAGFCG